MAGMPIPVHIDTRKDLFPRRGMMRALSREKNRKDRQRRPEVTNARRRARPLLEVAGIEKRGPDARSTGGNR